MQSPATNLRRRETTPFCLILVCFLSFPLLLFLILVAAEENTQEGRRGKGKEGKKRTIKNEKKGQQTHHTAGCAATWRRADTSRMHAIYQYIQYSDAYIFAQMGNGGGDT